MYGLTKKTEKLIEPFLKGRPLEKCYKEPEIYNLLPKATKIYLEYKPVQNINRKSLNKTADIIEKFGAIIAGSYRRGKEFCNDFDILYNKDPKKMLKKLKAIVFVQGEEIIRCVIPINGFYFMCDIFIYKDLAPYLLYATGSMEFNRRMRGIAKNKGYLLNQNGLFKNDEKIPCATENDIFKALGMEYLDPANRNW